MNPLHIRILTKEDIAPIVEAFKKIGWNKPEEQYIRYLKEQESGERLVRVALKGGHFAGYCTLKWKSDYRYFQESSIPEISDLNVLPDFRNQGIATALITTLETQAPGQGIHQIGIGVGLTRDYGNAQRLYTRLGYIPDGNGITYRAQPIQFGDSVRVDDDLVLWFTKFMKTRA